MIQTEKATDRWDLPHAFLKAGGVTSACKCTRGLDHALHQPVLLEKASASTTIVTEKGI